MGPDDWIKFSSVSVLWTVTNMLCKHESLIFFRSRRVIHLTSPIHLGRGFGIIQQVCSFGSGISFLIVTNGFCLLAFSLIQTFFKAVRSCISIELSSEWSCDQHNFKYFIFLFYYYYEVPSFDRYLLKDKTISSFNDKKLDEVWRRKGWSALTTFPLGFGAADGSTQGRCSVALPHITLVNLSHKPTSFPFRDSTPSL